MLNKINRALISVSDKSGLIELAKVLISGNVQIISTGGTANFLRSNNIEVTDISEITNFPEMLDGRVKTLHPLIHGGLLGCPDNAEHAKAMKEHKIEPIELVIVNLYPFEAVTARGATYEEAVENIDIGGPSMLRSAAKNHHYNTVICDPTDYATLIDELETNNMQTSLAFRKKLAAKTFARTACYDSVIANWFANQLGDLTPEYNSFAGKKVGELRYGENPHQQAAAYQSLSSQNLSVLSAKQVGGKELSYNNINDADASLDIISEFDQPACVIIKHANPCGVALADDILTAYTKALDADSLSAFGGIVALNRPLEADLASELAKIFLEVILVPSASEEAIAILAAKKNLRLLILPQINQQKSPEMTVKSINGGFLVQQQDSVAANLDELKLVTRLTATDQQLQDMIFANKVCKHVKSNAIVIAKNLTIIGVGAGQMSRIDSVKNAINKPLSLGKDKSVLENSVLASDAFFPFADSLEYVSDYGVTAVIQPGGSVKDNEVFETADKLNIAMYLTGKRHFKH